MVWTDKDRIPAIRSGLPFRILPYRMLIELVAFALMWLNAFPPSGGVSATHSSRKIIIGSQLDYNKHY